MDPQKDIAAALTEIEIALQNCAERKLDPECIAAALIETTSKAYEGIMGREGRRQMFQLAAEK